MATRKNCRDCGVDRHAGTPHTEACPKRAASELYWAERNIAATFGKVADEVANKAFKDTLREKILSE